MNRTTQRELAVLLRQARNALGVRKNVQIWYNLRPLSASVSERLGEQGKSVMVTPYANSSWMIYWIDPRCTENIRYVDPADFALPAQQFADKYITPNAASTNEAAG